MYIVEVVVLIVLKTLLLASATSDNFLLLKYSIPQPLIQVFKPKGIEVSIPHTPGIQLFAFHGNINKPMDGLEAGHLSKDILHNEGNFWKFKDTEIQLQHGDTIYFWLFVIRNKLGYRYDNGVYQINEITSGAINSDRSESHAIENIKNNNIERVCENVLLNLTQTHLSLDYELNSLRETNRIYEDLIGKHPDTATKLVVSGRLPPSNDPMYTVKDILQYRLDLPNIDVLRAERKEKNGRISFYVSTLEQKIAVIKRAREKLKNFGYTITY